MAQGGKRVGAGRPKGQRNKKTERQVASVEKGGITPLDYLLSVMRNENNEQAERIDAANKAAPYVHPKLSSVDHKSEDGTMTPPSKIVLEAVDDDSDC
jgi:hypothetical protein